MQGYVFLCHSNTCVPNGFQRMKALVHFGFMNGAESRQIPTRVCRQWFYSWQIKKIVVGAFYNVTWEEYEVTTGQSMPAGAVIGGFLAATNTQLYVSREETSKCNRALGYYNPLKHKALGECCGVKLSHTLEVMVELLRHVITWTFLNRIHPFLPL